MVVRYTDQVLNESPEKTTKFMFGVNSMPDVRERLRAVGFTTEAFAHGRALLSEVLGMELGGEFKAPPRSPAREALAQVDLWDEPTYARIVAVARHYHPEVEQYLFHDVAAARGVASVNGAAIILKRLDALEKGSDPERLSTRDADRDFIGKLAERGLSKSERQRVQGLVDQVFADPEPPAPKTPGVDVETRRAKLSELKAWLDDWVAMAKTVVPNRSQRIRLGIAQRKVRAVEEEVADTESDALDKP